MTKKKILVVDDDASVRQSLCRALLGAGYDVAMAEDGREAKTCFDHGAIDLLLLDVGLPNQNGWDTFERITTSNPRVPIIMITGQSGQLKTAKAAGVGALMEKPLDPSRLLQTIKDLLAEPEDVRLGRMIGQRQDVRHVPANPAERTK